MTEDPSPTATGERRRRRAEERRAATGEQQPMTRRERRALDEALASGALELHPDGTYAPTGEIPVTTTGQHVLPDPDARWGERADEHVEDAAGDGAAGDAAGDGAAVVDEDATAEDATADDELIDDPADVPVEDDTEQAGTAPERQSWRETAQEVNALRPAPTMGPVVDGGAQDPQVSSASSPVEPVDAPAGPAVPEGAASAAAPDPAASPSSSGRVSRRSLRELRAEGTPRGPEAPSERTATGRRPVIRPPASALGTRAVDEETGELTAIQRAIRDINAAPDAPAEDAPDTEVSAPLVATPAEPVAEEGIEPPARDGDDETADDAADQASDGEQAHDEPTAEAQTAEGRTAEGRTAEEPADAAGEVEDAGVEDDIDAEDEDEVDDTFDMSPRWPSVDSVAADDFAEVTDSDLEHEDEMADEDERHTPRLLQVLYWVVLVLAGLVLGLLVWQMASGNLLGGDDAASVAAVLVPIGRS